MMAPTTREAHRASVAAARGLFGRLVPAFRRWQRHDGARLGASIAFYSTLSLAPLLLVMAAVAAIFVGGDAARGYLVDSTGRLVGVEGGEMLRAMLKGPASSATRGLAAFIGLATTLLGATAAFAELQHALNQIFEVPAHVRALAAEVRSRALALLLVVGAALVAVLSLALTAAVTRGVGFLLHAERAVRLATLVANEALTLALVASTFAVVLKVLPDSRVAWRAAVRGGIVTAVLFHFGKLAIGWYIGRATGGGAYGAAAALVVLMLWIYWSAQIFLYGAAYTATLQRAIATDDAATADVASVR